MKLKLALIFSVIVVGFVFLAPDPFNPLKDKVAVIDKVGQNIDGLKDGIDSTIDNIGEKFDNAKDNPAEFLDEEITGEQESEIADEYTYHGEIAEDEPQTQAESPTQNNDITPQDETPQDDGILPPDVIPEEDGVLTETIEEPEIANNGLSTEEQLQSKLLKTLQLTTTQEDNGDVKVQYSDSTGNTISVKFTLKNSERDLFSGTFYASNFETSVTDISNTDHIIEMVVEHKEFGTITSSVYKPAGNLNTMINGVFMTS